MNKNIEPDTSIVVGDRVQSHDFPDRLVYGDRPPCYYEGVVIAIEESKMLGCMSYTIKADKRIWYGEQEPVWPYIVQAPVNGTPTTFGEKTFGVIKVAK